MNLRSWVSAPVASSSRRCGGRGFLLTTVYLYCLLNGKKVRACAPTGIASANIELEGSAVSASTLHCFFDLDGSYESRLDFSKTTNEKVDAVINLDVLMLDEVLRIIRISCEFVRITRDPLGFQ